MGGRHTIDPLEVVGQNGHDRRQIMEGHIPKFVSKYPAYLKTKTSSTFSKIRVASGLEGVSY